MSPEKPNPRPQNLETKIQDFLVSLGTKLMSSGFFKLFSTREQNGDYFLTLTSKSGKIFQFKVWTQQTKDNQIQVDTQNQIFCSMFQSANEKDTNGKHLPIFDWLNYDTKEVGEKILSVISQNDQ